MSPRDRCRALAAELRAARAAAPPIQVRPWRERPVWSVQLGTAGVAWLPALEVWVVVSDGVTDGVCADPLARLLALVDGGAG